MLPINRSNSSFRSHACASLLTGLLPPATQPEVADDIANTPFGDVKKLRKQPALIAFYVLVLSWCTAN